MYIPHDVPLPKVGVMGSMSRRRDQIFHVVRETFVGKVMSGGNCQSTSGQMVPLPGEKTSQHQMGLPKNGGIKLFRSNFNGKQHYDVYNQFHRVPYFLLLTMSKSEIRELERHLAICV